MIVPGRDARRVAARLCLVDFPGLEPTARLERLIADDHAAGVVLFRKNIASALQVAALTAALRRLARASGAPLPWVAIDHEGDPVDRFAPSGDGGFAPLAAASPPRPTALPSAMALGASGDPGLARAAGQVAGRELRALGITLNFAPVVDVNTNPANPIIGARAFGGSPALVAAMGAAYLRGLQAEGVAATAKHFPGHGDAAVDSHLALPVVAHARDRLRAVDLPPFRAAVRAGVAAVMTAHVAFPALDASGAPATLSGPVLTGLLRARWRYDGVVCTDSLGMRAIVDRLGVGEAAVAALRAGCDLVLALGPDALQDEVLERLARAVEDGAVSAARVAEAHRRLARAAAAWVAAGPPPAPAGDLAAVLGVEAHRRLAARIAEAAVTLVRDAGALPLEAAAVQVVPVGAGAPAAALAAALTRHGAAARVVDAGRVEPGVPAVAVTRTRGALPAAHAAALRGLAARARRLAVVAAGDPYDVAACPDAAAVATYSADPASLDAAARVLLGRLRPSGRLPVVLSGTAPAGAGRA